MKGYFYYAAICLTSRSDHTSPSGIKHAHCTYFMGKNNVYVRYVRSQLDQLAFVLINLFFGFFIGFYLSLFGTFAVTRLWWSAGDSTHSTY